MLIVIVVAVIPVYSMRSNNYSNYDNKKTDDYDSKEDYYSLYYKSPAQTTYNSDLNYNPDMNSYYDDNYNRNKIIYYLDDYDDDCYVKVYNNNRDEDDDTEYYIYHYDKCISRLRIRYNFDDPYYELHGRNYYLRMRNDCDYDYYYEGKGRRHYSKDCDDDRYDDDRDERDGDKDYDRNGNDDYKSINYPHDGPLGQKHLQYHKDYNTRHYIEDHMN